ncbi:MAG: magnesium transporter CorA family protein [Peptococcaceae bacterium]|nr:magnesium transporter CorA family protein [Peptococcaceae bacterium]
MYSIYQSTDQYFYESALVGKGCWIHMIAPTEEELQMIASDTGAFYDFLRYPLDDEERPRMEIEDKQILTIIDIPNYDKDSGAYETLPMGIIINEDHVITVCLKDTGILDDFIHNRVKPVVTFKKTRFLFLLLYKNAMLFLRYLRELERSTNVLEKELQKSMRNRELIRLMNVGKSLVYFSTSLRSNQAVLERLMRTRALKKFEEDDDLLEDVIIENKQAIEMAGIYTNILNSTMETSATIVSNNLNGVMKFLAAITIIMSLPTMVASFFGVNVPVPFQFMAYPYGFAIVVGISVVISAVAIWFLYRKDMF